MCLCIDGEYLNLMCRLTILLSYFVHSINIYFCSFSSIFIKSYFLGVDYIIATTKLITGRTLLRSLVESQDRAKIVDGPAHQ